MLSVNIHDANTHLSKLLLKVAAGEEVIISRAGKPIARLVGFARKKDRRKGGFDRGLYTVPDDFNETSLMNAGRPAKYKRTKFGSRLAAARQKAGLSQSELGERLGLSQRAIGRASQVKWKSIPRKKE